MSTTRRLTIQTALTVQPQRLVQNEREYLVAPCVMIVEGVLNGGYVPGDEIRACHWDGIPLVINHPLAADGTPISANSPDVPPVGRVFRTQYSALQAQGHTLTRAQAELWLDVAQVEALGGEALQAMQMLETQTPLEVSTAFFSDAEPTRGSFLGVRYNEIHHNLRADHLALLPNSIGACNWQNGCGSPRLNEQGCSCGATDGCSCQRQESSMSDASPSRWQRFMSLLQQCVQEEDDTLTLNVLAQARRPSFEGTETSVWMSPSFATYVRALSHGDTPPSSVADASQALKRQIAAHTLLGDPEASSFGDLSFFPVVNPRTGKLNEHALRAVIGGRGSQATIPGAARSSAQEMARRLLNSEFDAHLETNQVDTDVREALYGALAREMGVDTTPLYLDSVDHPNQTFTYRQGERLVQRGWTMQDGVLALTPDQQDVQRDTRFVPVTAARSNESSPDGRESAHNVSAAYAVRSTQEREQQETHTMAQPTEAVKALVSALITNAQTPWTDEDRPALEAMSATQLARLQPQAAQTAAEPQTLDQAIATLPAQFREPVGTLAREHAARKDAAIAVLVANKAPLSEGTLKGMSLDELEGLVAMAGQQTTYTGKGLPHVRPTLEDDAPPAPPNTLERVVERQKQLGLR
jgi:hypothetical protein